MVVVLLALLVLIMIIMIIIVFKLTKYTDVQGNVRIITYLDNNGTTKIFNESLELMDHIYKYYYGNASAIYGLGAKSKKLLETCRNRMSKMLNCDSCELYFTSGATESNNIAIRGVYTKHTQKGKHIITTSIEHPSVSETVKSLEGSEVTFLPVDKYGRINLLELENAIRQDTILVTVIHGSNEIGTIQDIKAIADICKRKKIHFHVDMTQMIGKYRIDLNALGVTSATGSGHKFHGPKATGFLYLQKGKYFQTCISGGHQEKNIRSGTENVPGIVAMTYSLYICNHLLRKNKDKEIRAMRDWMRDTLVSNIPSLIVNGNKDDRYQMYNTLSICLPVNSRKVVMMLDKNNIYVNTGSACSKNKLSSVLHAIGLTEKEREGSLRISLGFLNTWEDCQIGVKSIIYYTRMLLAQGNP
jgi:cysteine desulfurase